jgi:homoserine kinase
VALRIYNSVTIARGAKKPAPPIVDEAAQLFFNKSGTKSFPFACSISQQVPRARGLGSSATVRLGVLHGLNRLAASPLDRSSIFELCAKLEGHPDNAAPSSFGGFTVVRGANVQRFNVSPKLHFVLLVPDLEIETSKARRILPQRVLRGKAVESCGNACAITAAFAGSSYTGLRGAFRDHLHQPFREKLIPFLSRVIAAAEEAGALGAFLSGSGSTIAAVTLQSPQEIAQAMRRAATRTSARTIVTTADNRGVHFLKIRNPKSKLRN